MVVPGNVLYVIVDVQISSPCHDSYVMQSTHSIYTGTANAYCYDRNSDAANDTFAVPV